MANHAVFRREGAPLQTPVAPVYTPQEIQQIKRDDARAAHLAHVRSANEIVDEPRSAGTSKLPASNE